MTESASPRSRGSQIMAGGSSSCPEPTFQGHDGFGDLEADARQPGSDDSGACEVQVGQSLGAVEDRFDGDAGLATARS